MNWLLNVVVTASTILLITSFELKHWFKHQDAETLIVIATVLGLVFFSA